jgi:Zn-dependent M28 family amino/carboxypeptidase
VNGKLLIVLLACALCACSHNENVSAQNAATPQAAPSAPAAVKFDGEGALKYTSDVVAFGPRWPGSLGHDKVQAYLREKLKGDHVEEDSFTASTPAGAMKMTNFIVKFPGSKPGIIVVTGHYDTLYNRKDFVGANDAGSSTGLLLQLAASLRENKNLSDMSVWLVFFDGEEAVKTWTDTDSTYGSRHLAAKWNKDGTAKKIKALLLVDMVGDADLNILRESNSTPWLEDVIYNAATRVGVQNHFFGRSSDISDDHVPFSKIGVPVADLIDFNYGPPDERGGGGAYWHTAADTMDKLSAQSLEVVGSVVLETIRMLGRPANTPL